MLELRNATIAARQRTGNKGISVRVEAGRFDVVNAQPSTKSGKFDVELLRANLTLSEVIAYLHAL